MVGVPGKSKGCNTCRKRKVKCDGERPACRKCRKSKRECMGYQRDMHFKNLSHLDSATLVVRKQPLNPITESSVLRFNGVEDSSRGDKGRDLYVENESSGFYGEQSETGRTTFSQLFEHFLSNYVPHNSTDKEKLQVSWLESLPSMQSQASDASLNLAVTALSLVRLGRKHHSPELQAEGMAVYGQALEGLQKMLCSEDLVFQENTLASCMTLSIFEVLETSGSNVHGWISHVEGLSHLFQLRGPSLHIIDSSHKLFLGFRPTGIIHALAIRKASYLGTEPWLTIPWQLIRKSDFHRLLDIIATIPATLEKMEQTISSPIPLNPMHTTLTQKLHSIEFRLREWYTNLSANFQGTLYTEHPALPILCTNALSLQTLSPTSLSFPTFEIARMHHFYWASLLGIYDNLVVLSSRSFHLPPLAHLRQKIKVTASLITQSIPYLLSPEAHILGPQNVFFPLRIAMQAYERLGGRDVEVQWCRDVFDEMDRRGYSFGKILAGVRWEDMPGFLCGAPAGIV